jgi:uncharacterized protein involved in exopolysaccharide biosynthesis
MPERRTVFSLLDDVVGHLRLVLGISLAAALVTSAIVLIMPATYASSASFVPESQSQQRLPASLTGLASQLGVNIGNEPSRSPPFYADLLRSREILERVLSARVPNPFGKTDSVAVSDLYRIKGETSELRVEDGVKALRNKIAVAVDQRTGVVRFDVEARTPTGARDVARLLLQQVSSFNVDTRQSIARNRRLFVEGRVAAAERDLEAAENALRGFYDRNRQWQNSPQLRFEEQRLGRQVSVQQELYLTLRREYETARIEEVNNIPLLTVIDEPNVPGRRIRPKRTVTVLLTTLVIALLACGVAIGIERHHELLASGEPDYLRLRDRLRTIASRPQTTTSVARR